MLFLYPYGDKRGASYQTCPLGQPKGTQLSLLCLRPMGDSCPKGAKPKGERSPLRFASLPLCFAPEGQRNRRQLRCPRRGATKALWAIVAPKGQNRRGYGNNFPRCRRGLRSFVTLKGKGKGVFPLLNVASCGSLFIVFVVFFALQALPPSGGYRKQQNKTEGKATMPKGQSALWATLNERSPLRGQLRFRFAVAQRAKTTQLSCLCPTGNSLSSLGELLAPDKLLPGGQRCPKGKGYCPLGQRSEPQGIQLIIDLYQIDCPLGIPFFVGETVVYYL